MATYPPDTKPGRGAGCSARQTVLSPPRGSLSRSPPRPRARRLDGSRLDRVPCSLRAGGSLASGIHESGCSQSICKRALLREGCGLRRPAARAHLFVSSRKSGFALFRPGKTNPHDMGSLPCRSVLEQSHTQSHTARGTHPCRSVRKQIHTTWAHCPVARCENTSTRHGLTALSLGGKTKPHDMGSLPCRSVRN